jgi:hypothetical protein
LGPDGSYFEGVQVGQAFVNHFQGFMGTKVDVFPTDMPDSLFVKKLSRSDADSMVCPVTKEK